MYMRRNLGTVVQSFSVSPELMEAIRRAANAENMTISGYLREATKRALKRTGIAIERPARRPASASAETAQAQAA